MAKRKIVKGTIEYKQEYEFIQDSKYPLTDEGIQSFLLNHYLSLYPIYEDAKKYISTVFLVKTAGRILGMVTTLKK